MSEKEEYFPRGGKKPITINFNTINRNFLGDRLPNNKKKKHPIKEKRQNDDGYLSDSSYVERTKFLCNNGINYNSVEKDVIMLARVKEAVESKIFVSLPGRMTGILMACYINDAYTKMLQDFVDDKSEKIPELSKIFKKGQYIAVKVLGVKRNNENVTVLLTAMPQHINSNYVHTDINKGVLIQGAVTSVEDHGYVIDLGIGNTRAFLKKTDNMKSDIDVGHLIWCAVKKTTSDTNATTVTLTNELESLENATIKYIDEDATVRKLLPGMAVEFIIEEAFENGIEGRIYGSIQAFIHRYHIENIRGRKPQLSQKIRPRLLYVLPTTKSPFFTMKNIFTDENEQKYKVGDIIETAKVIKITGKTIILKLDENNIATISKKQLQYVNEDDTDEEIIMKSYPLGSLHMVRILYYHLCDYIYACSDAPDIISEKYFTFNDIQVGDVIHDATIKSCNSTYIHLKFGRIQGTVPKMHWSDTGTVNDIKKESLMRSKYKVGQKVKARVIWLDRELGKCMLTMKPTYLNDDIEIIKDLENVKVGQSYKGFIKNVTSDGIIVGFFNNISARIAKNHISVKPIDNLLDAFHCGQIVNCVVLKVKPKRNVIIGSLRIPCFVPNEGGINQNTIKQQKDSESLNIERTETPRNKDRAEQQLDLSKNDRKKHKENQKAETKSDEYISESKDMLNEKKKKDKRKKNKTHKSEESNAIENNYEDIIKKKKLNSESDLNENEYNQKAKGKQKKDKKSKLESDGSDAIESDYDEEAFEVNALTNEDLTIINLDDCVTQKNFKKRIISLTKSIQSRTRRLNVIETRLHELEEKGIDVRTKPIHTKMRLEKLVIECRLKHLMKALTQAQLKFDEFPKQEKVDYKRKRKIPETVELNENKMVDCVYNESNKKKLKPMEVKVLECNDVCLELPSVQDFWSANADTISNNVKMVEESEVTSSSDEEVEEAPKRKRKKQSEAERINKARREEEQLREIERKIAIEEHRPQSSEQFERLLLAQPNNSGLWIAYMAFYLQTAEIDKARGVGKKALQTISFREEGEKLNVWLAMLNFEHRFGSKETQKQTLEEALQMNDTFKVHSKLVDIYVETNQADELAALVELMLKKYKRDPNTYILCGGACFKTNLIEKARAVMQKAITVLEKKEHIAVIVQFAKLEREYGDSERAEALLEQIVGVYPQRVDIWCVYVDMLNANKDIDNIRLIMERAVSNKLPARKMKTLYKKWIVIEEQYGDSKQIEKVRKLALEFIEKATF